MGMSLFLNLQISVWMKGPIVWICQLLGPDLGPSWGFLSPAGAHLGVYVTETVVTGLMYRLNHYLPALGASNGQRPFTAFRRRFERHGLASPHAV